MAALQPGEERDYRYVLNGRPHITGYTWPCLRTLLARAAIRAYYEAVASRPVLAKAALLRLAARHAHRQRLYTARTTFKQGSYSGSAAV